MKTSAAIILVSALVACLPACGGSDGPADGGPDGLSDGTGGDTSDAGGDPADAGADTDIGDGSDGADGGEQPDYEARGVWVTRWNYSSRSDVESIVADLAGHGFNQIYFQVRGTADAYYASSHEPWAARLTGSLGQDPGWDPLQAAIDEAHAAGIEVHAWLNTYPAWTCGTAAPVSTGIPHVLQTHPEWAAADGDGTSMYRNCQEGYVFLNPANPIARDHIRAVVSDIVSNYAVDGIHLDYIRYPGIDYSHDAVSLDRFSEARDEDPDLAWADWQRAQVDALVAGVYADIESLRPEVVLSAAVWFIYENIWDWPAVSQGYHQYYQDPRAWTAAGDIDVVVPMIYFPLSDPPGERLDFAAMLADHVEGNSGRLVYAGIHGDYDYFTEIEAEIAETRELDSAGFVVFAYSYIVDHDWWDDFSDGPLFEPAVSPPMPWKGGN